MNLECMTNVACHPSPPVPSKQVKIDVTVKLCCMPSLTAGK